MYLRVSTRQQAEYRYSIDSQKNAIYSYVEREEASDHVALSVYIDDGYSAKNLKRPAMSTLIHDIKLGNITKVYVYRIVRLTRSVKDMLYFTDLFNEYNVHLVSLYERFDASTASGRLLVGEATQMAQWEREIISERTKEGMKQGVSDGKYSIGGKISFGYDKDNDGKLVLNDIRREWILYIYIKFINNRFRGCNK